MENKIEMQQLAEAGRGTDKVMAHMSLGEIVIPRAFLDDPEVMQILQQIFEAGGADINEFTVGHEANKINPETGYPEFFFKKLKSIFKAVAPIAVSFIPGIGPLAGAALGAGLGAISGGGLKGALSGALSGYAGAGGGSILGKALGATGATATGLGSGLLGAGAGGISGGAKGALLGGALGGIGGYATGGGFDDLYNGSALQSTFTGASGALDKLNSGVSDLYSGSALQDVFKSGGDALKSIGINTGTDSLKTGVGAAGGGASPYSAAEKSLLDNANSVLTSGATNVASSNYLSPIASALLGSYTNDKAEDQLLAQQEANKALLAPYQNFQFTPGDLTQDPGYQFNLEEGNRALDRSQLARGGYFSGEALREAQKFGQGLADNTYNTAFTRALQTQGAGLQAANALTGVNDNVGNIRAGSTVNTGNLFSGALGSALGGNSFTNSGALQGGGNDYLSNLLRQLKMQQITGAMA